MEEEIYYLADYSMHPAQAIAKGTLADCEETLKVVAEDGGYYHYKIITEEAFKELQKQPWRY